MKSFFWYLFAVLVFGSITGWSNSLESESTLYQELTEGYVIQALMWGCIYFHALLLSWKILSNRRLISIVGLSIIASAVTYLFFWQFGDGEIIKNVVTGWGGDRSLYKEYPIKGYQIMSLMILVLYLVSGIGFWILSEHETD